MSIRPTADIRRRLLAGEELTADRIIADYGVTGSLLHGIVRGLRVEGKTFTAELIPGPGNPKKFRITLPTPGYDEREWGKGSDVVSLQAKKKKAAAKRAPLVPKPPEAPKPRKPQPLDVPVPALGTTLRVALLMVNDDGVVTIGINNGTQAWTAEIVGYTKREEQFDGNREG